MRNINEAILTGLSPDAFENELKKLQKQAETNKSLRKLAAASARILENTWANNHYAKDSLA